MYSAINSTSQIIFRLENYRYSTFEFIRSVFYEVFLLGRFLQAYYFEKGFKLFKLNLMMRSSSNSHNDEGALSDEYRLDKTSKYVMKWSGNEIFQFFYLVLLCRDRRLVLPDPPGGGKTERWFIQASISYRLKVIIFNYFYQKSTSNKLHPQTIVFQVQNMSSVWISDEFFVFNWRNRL